MPAANNNRLVRMCMTITLGTMALSALPGEVYAQTYPNKPIRFVTPYGSGGNADILTRIIGDAMSKSMGQPVLVDNRPGGSSTIGSAIVAKAPPDGYTIMLISSSHSVNPSLFGSQLPYDTVKDFTPISMTGATPILVVVNPGVAANNVRELVALAKTKPGTLNFATSGNGSPAHLAGALIEALGGVKLVHVPYKTTAQANNDTMSGQVQIAFPSVSSALPMVKSGKLRALGITSLKRSALAPDIPTVAESLPGYQASIWTGVLAPAAVPRPIVTRLNAEVVKALTLPDVVTKLTGMGVDIDTSTPEEFGAFIDAEIRKWARVIKEGNIKVEMER
jgi:tripartite-type tricarboxylate transporter receptor subunit TctC